MKRVIFVNSCLNLCEMRVKKSRREQRDDDS